MPRHPVVPLSSGADGLNRFNDGHPSKLRARQHELSEGLDVVNITGNLQRREAFVATHLAAPHVLPCGMAHLHVVDAAETSWSSRVDRDGSLQDQRLYFGADVRFNGILFEHLSLGAGNTTTPLTTKLYYYDGTSWVEIFHYDLTRAKTSSSADRFQPWQRNGMIAWHYPIDSLGDPDWDSSTVNSVAKFWVRIDCLHSTTGVADAPDVAATVVAPGLRACQFGEVNGLIAARMGNGEQQLIVGSDRWKNKRGSELGAQLGVVRGFRRAARKLRIIYANDLKHEGAAWYGVDTNNNWAGAASWTEGTANELEKIRQDFQWNAEDETASSPGPITDFRSPYAEFRGARVIANLVVASVGSGAITFDGTPAIGATTGQYEHHVLRCVKKGAGGTVVGEERIVHASSGETLDYYDAFSVTPDTNNQFDLLRPHHDVSIVSNNGFVYMVDNMDSGGHRIGFARGRPFATDPDVAATQPTDQVHFEVSRDMRWAMRSGLRWTGVVDSITRKAILANGGPLLEYDGRRLRRYKADTTSDQANILKAKIGPPLRTGGAPGIIEIQELLGTPPECKYVVDYGGFLVCAGITGEPQAVRWSMPGGSNNVWPKIFIQNISDNENDAVSGMTVMGSQLVIYTPTAIHEASRPDPRGYIQIRRVSAGLGFVAHHAVSAADFEGNPVLFGCAAGGVHMYRGAGQWNTILDKWDRVFDVAVNHRQLHRAVSACWQERNWYMLALPVGGSTKNNRLYVYDWINRRHWVWTLPWGVSSMVSSKDPNGRETVFFGSDDGFVHTLHDAPTDDGKSVSGEAKTIPYRPGADRQVAFTRLLAEVSDLGGHSLTVKTYLDEKQSYGGRTTPADATQHNQTKAATHTSGQSRYGSSSTDANGAVMNTSIRGHKHFIDTELPLKKNSRGQRFAVEISGDSRWTLKNLSVQARPLGHKRGKRRG